MMRAKMRVVKVAYPYEGAEQIELTAVCGNAPFGPNGENEDNTYARYTPSADLAITITNPNLLGKIQPDQKFYVDFTPAQPN